MRNENDLNRPVIQKVIAEHSGVSPSLVSRILSGRLEKAIVIRGKRVSSPACCGRAGLSRGDLEFVMARGIWSLVSSVVATSGKRE